MSNLHHVPLAESIGICILGETKHGLKDRIHKPLKNTGNLSKPASIIFKTVTHHDTGFRENHDLSARQPENNKIRKPFLFTKSTPCSLQYLIYELRYHAR